MIFIGKRIIAGGRTFFNFNPHPSVWKAGPHCFQGYSRRNRTEEAGAGHGDPVQ